MLEWYRANAGVDDVMRDTEQLVAAVTGGSGDARRPARSTCGPPLERLGGLRRRSSASPGGRAERDARRGGSRRGPLLPRARRRRSSRRSKCLDRGVFLVDYPATQASLARKKPGDPRLAERFELYVAGVELCNGFGELVDPAEQRARLEHDQRSAASARAARLPHRRALPRGARAHAAERGATPSASTASSRSRCGTTEIADVMAFTADEL